jgi:hypothetical protein
LRSSRETQGGAYPRTGTARRWPAATLTAGSGLQVRRRSSGPPAARSGATRAARDPGALCGVHLLRRSTEPANRGKQSAAALHAVALRSRGGGGSRRRTAGRKAARACGSSRRRSYIGTLAQASVARTPRPRAGGGAAWPCPRRTAALGPDGLPRARGRARAGQDGLRSWAVGGCWAAQIAVENRSAKER